MQRSWTSSACLVALVLCTTLTFSYAIEAQQPSVTESKPDPVPTPSPKLDFWHQETMTGDWGGRRDRWREQGLEMEFIQSSFVQGTASGGLRHATVLNGKIESKFKLDLEKLWGWENWSAESKVEYRFGAPALSGTGAINSVNTDVTVPTASGSVVAITSLNFTRVFPLNRKKGEEIAVSFGRYNTLEIQEKFFGGAGLEKFFSVAHIGPMTGLRQIPNVTNGVSIDYSRNGESFIAFGVLDPNDHSTDIGFDHLFADGVTLGPVINLPTHWFGKNGKHSFSYTVTTKKFTPFDAIKQVVIPGPPLTPVQPKRGSFSVSYVGRQFLIERVKGDGWGVFIQVSIADKDTSPVTRFFDLGVGGNGLFARRPQDEFGIAFAYTGLSSVLTENLDLVTIGNVRPRAEHQLEAFYNLHITPWFRLTGDLQIIRPVVRRATTAVIPGARLEFIF